MQFTRRSVCVLASLLAMALLPCAVQAAAQKALGGSGYSGTLSSNPSIRQQQLLCDPPGTLLGGSMTTQYDTNVVTFAGSQNENGYTNSLFVAVEPIINIGAVSDIPQGSTGSPEWVSEAMYLALPSSFVELGFVQDFFQSTVNSTSGHAMPPPGFTTVGAGGPSGTDTFGLLFNYLPAIQDSTVASYTNFPIGGNYHPPTMPPPSSDFNMGGQMDSLTFSTDTGTVTYPATQIDPITVSGSLSVVPEPQVAAAASVLLAGFAAWGFARRVRASSQA